MSRPHKIAPSILFPLLSALGFNFMILNAIRSGLLPQLLGQCPGSGKYWRTYTGLPYVDQALCMLTTLFHLALEEPIMTYLVTLIPPLGASMMIEASRQKPFKAVTYPTTTGLISQVLSFSVVVPSYWYIFVTSGSAKRADAGAAVSRADGRAILFGQIFGSILPTAGLLLLKNPAVTIFWQLFPLWSFVARKVLDRRGSGDKGYGAIRSIYILSFVLAAVVHGIIVFPRILGTDPVRSLQTLFLPSLKPLGPSAPIIALTKDMIQWDFVFATVSSLLATLWFAKSAKQLVAILAWYIVTSPLVGPWAAFSAIALWRESTLLQKDDNAASSKRN